MKSFKHLVIPGLLSLGVCNAAQPVYRCGNSYSQTPCAGAAEVPIDDPRTEEQRAQAKQGLRSDKALAKDMEASRRKDEAQALAADKLALARAEAAHKQEVKKPPSKKDSKKRRAKQDEYFTTTVKKKSSTPSGKSSKP